MSAFVVELMTVSLSKRLFKRVYKMMFSLQLLQGLRVFVTTHFIVSQVVNNVFNILSEKDYFFLLNWLGQN